MRMRLFRRGFTFVEVLLALVVLSFGIFGTLDLYSTASSTAARSSNRTQGFFLAKLQLATLEGAGYESLIEFCRNNPPPTGSTVVAYPADWQQVSQNTKFVWSAELQPPENEGGPIVATVYICPADKSDKLDLTDFIYPRTRGVSP